MADESSYDRVSQAKKNFSTVFRRFQKVGQNTVAQQLSVSDALISEWKNKDCQRAMDILAALGLKAVSVEMQCYYPKTLAAILQLAGERMEQLNETPEQLVQDWDKPE